VAKHRDLAFLTFGVLLAVAGLPGAGLADDQGQPAVGNLQITVSTAMTLYGSTATAEQEAALAAQVRASLYKMGASECALIEQTFKAKCSLEQVQVNTRDLSDAQYGGNPMAREGVTAQGNFTYRLTGGK
jgi:hypothetical protein